MKTYKYTIVLLTGFLAVCALAYATQTEAPYVGSEAFERLKLLAGQWEGTMDTGQGPQKIRASYKVTSGGSAIVETVFEGTPHEMVTVYHDNPDRQVRLTHYCMLHNQPRMVLKHQQENKLAFDLAEDSGIDVATQWHMHAVTITIEGRDRLTQLWTEYKNGQPGKHVEIAYNRVK